MVRLKYQLEKNIWLQRKRTKTRSSAHVAAALLANAERLIALRKT